MALHFRTGRPLGSDAFVTELERETGRVLKKRRPGRKPSGYLVASQDVADPGN
jgi:hypothetical protein